MKKLKTAIIGLGSIHATHVNALRELEEAELVAVCDVLPELVQEKAAEYGVPGYTDYMDMLMKEDIDVVHICTPHYLHQPMAVDCLQMGKHVLTEKPMGMNTQETEAMIQAEKDTGLHLGICFQNRYNPTSVRIREVLDSGILGELKGARMAVLWDRGEAYYGQAAWRGTWKMEGGGVLINQAIHTLDLMQWFTGFPVDVQAQTSAFRLSDCIEVEDTAHGMFHYENGTRGVFYTTIDFADNDPIEIELILEKGKISLRDTLKITYPDGHIEELDDSHLASGEKSYWGTSHRLLIQDFYHSILEDRPFPINGEEGCKAIRLIEGIYRSSQMNHKIRF